MKNFVNGTLLLLSLCVLGLSACQSKSSTESASDSSIARDSSQQLSQKGRTVYQSNCTACHNTDPKKAGALGPEVWGSSRELLEARVLKAEYPAGYKPKRATHAMAALPQLKNDIDALTAYLNEK